VTDLRALVFDVFGTVVDWRSGVLAEAEAVARRTGTTADWAAVVDDWRRAYQPSLLAARRSSTWRDLDALHRDSLDTVLTRHGLRLPEAERAALVGSWRRLPAWPDAGPGLERLRRRYVTATLSNGHVALLVDLVRFADLRFDAVLSAQLSGSYKPDPVVYARAAELLGLAPGQLGMVAAHAQDLQAAAEVGLRPLFVRRPHEWGQAGGDEPPYGLPGLLVATSLEDLAGQLGA
jgi:2-haloacid dehalogenase